MEDMKGLWYAMAPPRRAADGTISADARIPADSPWFDGHFPDAPVLPAIAQLDMVIAMIAEAEGAAFTLKSATRAKFKRLIGPGAALVLTARPEAPSGEARHYRYHISEGGNEAASGNLVLIPKTAATEAKGTAV